MRNYGWEIREQANEMVSRCLEALGDEAIDWICSGRTSGTRHILYAAAEIVLFANLSGDPLPDGDDFLYAALEQAEWTRKKFGRLPKRAQAVVRAALDLIVRMGQPSPEDPDRARTEAPEPAESDGDQSHQEEIDKAVGSVLRQYRYNAGTLGPAAADRWAEEDIAREASRIAPHFPDRPNPAWQRVHDAIRRRFNRFVVHVDDAETLPDGEYQVWIKGWNCWVPARIEREGRTWKLPIGRVNGVGIERTVAAVRPLALIA